MFDSSEASPTIAPEKVQKAPEELRICTKLSLMRWIMYGEAQPLRWGKLWIVLSVMYFFDPFSVFE